MILYFAPGGRLGNLFFQISFLNHIQKPRERIFATQLKQAPKYLSGLRRFYNSNNKVLINLIDYLLGPLLKLLLVRTRLISSLLEKEGKTKKIKGLLPITYIEGYFQKSVFSGSAVGNIILNARTKNRGLVLCSVFGKRRPVFIHVRRTDYKDFSPMGGKSVQLPPDFYHRAISKFFPQKEEFLFIIVGDDPDWAEIEFDYLPYKTVSRQSPETDLAAMSLCEGGIISNSTFAWWGAFWCQRKAPVIGPEYWLGWRHKIWYPEGIKPTWMETMEVANK